MSPRSKQLNVSKAMDFTEQFRNSLSPKRPFESIVDFVVHKSFCGYEPYPRQLTLLKLIYLETENMSQYDIDVIEKWRLGFGGRQSMGVQPDIWERVAYLKKNGYRRFPHVQSVLGRRASKGWIGGILGGETAAYMVSLDDWQRHYHVQPGKDSYLNAIATNFQQAQKNLFADIRNVINDCAWLQPYISASNEYKIHLKTPADSRRQADMLAKGLPIDQEIATVRVLALTSTSTSGRGSAVIANFYDEFAHMIVGTGGPRSSEEVYEAYQPALRQFKKDGLTYLPSSPFSKVGKFYDLYTKGSVPTLDYLEKTGGFVEGRLYADDLEDDPEATFVDLTANPEFLIVQLPSWGLYEDWERSYSISGIKKESAVMEYDIPMRRLEQSNPSKFKVEYNAQFAEVEDAYLDPIMVERMFKPWQGQTLSPVSHGSMEFKYHAHIDPGLSNANFALAIGHLEDAEPNEAGEIFPHVIIDMLKVWKAKDYKPVEAGAKPNIPFDEVFEEISEIIGEFPSMEMFSSDQWQSAYFLAALKKRYSNRTRIKEVTFTEKENKDRYDYFKSALNLGWVHSIKDNFFANGESLLEQELKFLTENNGKVQKQEFGMVQTKDLSDCVTEITARMLKKALDHWRSGQMGTLGLSSSAAQKTRVIDNQSRSGQFGNARETLSGFGRGVRNQVPSSASRGRFDR